MSTYTKALSLPAGHYPLTATMVGLEGLAEWQSIEAGRLLSIDYAMHLESIALGAGLDVQVLGNGELVSPVDQAASVVVWWAEQGKEEMSMWEPAPDTWVLLMEG